MLSEGSVSRLLVCLSHELKSKYFMCVALLVTEGAFFVVKVVARFKFGRAME